MDAYSVRTIDIACFQHLAGGEKSLISFWHMQVHLYTGKLVIVCVCTGIYRMERKKTFCCFYLRERGSLVFVDCIFEKGKAGSGGVVFWLLHYILPDTYIAGE